MRSAGLALVFTLVAPCVAMADGASDAALLARFGALGLTAVDCSAPPATANPYVEYALKNGKVARRLQMGQPKLDGEYETRNVRQLDARRLRMESSDASGAYATVTMMFDGATHYTEHSERDGKVFIDNGRFTSGGPVPRFVRCGR